MVQKKVSLQKLLKDGKCLFLAYDQGLEHGPTDFNDKNVDPRYIIDLAAKGGYNALIVQQGIAEKYSDEIKKSKVPLIVKLNGKTNLVKGEPYSTQLCTVKEAKSLGAVAVGYTLYIGSAHEGKMMKEFEKIEREAHKLGLPVIAWIYPRGKSVENKDAGELLAYATRTALELGADIVKIHWETTEEELAWAVKAAGKVKVVIAGGSKADEGQLLVHAREAITAGVTGFAIGRNAWQHANPLELTKKLQKIIWP